MVTSSESASHTLLRGTPVVPGFAHGPALVARGEVSPDAIARFGTGSFPDADADRRALERAGVEVVVA